MARQGHARIAMFGLGLTRYGWYGPSGRRAHWLEGLGLTRQGKAGMAGCEQASKVHGAAGKAGGGMARPRRVGLDGLGRVVVGHGSVWLVRRGLARPGDPWYVVAR
jgi:hypothetical protein